MSFNIVVALDESPWSEAAAETALRVAARAPEGCKLVAVHVVNVTHLTGKWLHDLAGLLGWEPMLVPPKVEGLFRARGQALLDAFGARCERAGLEVQLRLDQGAVARRLLHWANAGDLMIMGRGGETELQYPGQGGGNMQRVVREARAPVLLTPREPLELSGITLGYDGSDGAQVALRVVTRLASRLSLPVRVRYVRDGRRPAAHAPLGEAVQHLQSAGVDVRGEESQGEAHEVLAALAAEAGDDVLALGYRGRSLLKGILLGRVPTRLLGQLELGLLIAH